MQAVKNLTAQGCTGAGGLSRSCFLCTIDRKTSTQKEEHSMNGSKTVARAFLFTAAVLLPGRPPAAAATYHVSPAGNDANSGQSGSPWKTLGKAASVASAGDTVLLAGGTYREAVAFSRSGTAAAPISFQNEPGAVPVIDGSGLPAGPLLNLNGVSRIKLTGLTIRNSTGFGLQIAGASQYVDLAHLDVSGSATSGVWIQTTGTTPTFVTVKDSRVHDNGTGGITVWLAPGGYIAIERNEVFNNAGAGNFDGIQVG